MEAAFSGTAFTLVFVEENVVTIEAKNKDRKSKDDYEYGYVCGEKQKGIVLTW